MTQVKSCHSKNALYKRERIYVYGIRAAKFYVVRVFYYEISDDFFPVFLEKTDSHLFGEIPVDDPDFEWLTEDNDPVTHLSKYARYKGQVILVHSKYEEEYYSVGYHEGNLPNDFFPSHVCQNKGETVGRIPVGDPDLIFLNDEDEGQKEE